MNSEKQVVVIGGPSGSGKDTIVRELLKRFPNTTLAVSATTRAMRPGEADGVNYHYLTNNQFQKELAEGHILESYHRADTDTYYGTYKPDIESKLATGKTVIAIVQIVGARYFKDHYNASTVFIVPPPMDILEKRMRARSAMSDTEWAERRALTESEIVNDAPWYDYRVANEEGELEKAVQEVSEILRKEKYIID